eukprot:TRINITY_DN8610_c0_g1_i1.p3 TRINITY_DN8610_c0_g1~~TRINITY_DN8610_c0_g1_i1.p3  ORF type:complete len:115 (+),score=11.54 TRINITY_DN8610_c0_g1_i1:130-474(+)
MISQQEKQRQMRQQLIRNDQSVDQQGQQLTNIERDLHETEQLGAQVNLNLKKQGDQLRQANEDTKEVQHITKQVDKVAREITTRELCVRVVLFLTAVALFAAVIIVLIVKLKNR